MRRTLAEVSAQPQSYHKVVNHRSEFPKVLRSWLEKGDHIVCIDRRTLAEARASKGGRAIDPPVLLSLA
jgi:hypothetical protein